MAKTIGWGLIGASNIARQRVAGAIQASEAGHIAAVMSHNHDLAASFAKEFGIPRHYASLDEMLAGPDIQAVYVSSTNEHHFPQVMRAARAGKHVLCEKPLTCSLDSGRQMVIACRAAGVVMGTNHHLRNAVTIRAMREAVMAGAIGTPIAALVSQPAFVPLGEWRRKNPASGSGVSFDVLVHGADAIRFILNQEPVEVCALANSSPAMAAGVADTIMATYRFSGGVLAQVYADFNVTAGRSRIEINGSAGTLVGSDVLGKNSYARGQVILRRDGGQEIIAEESDNSRYLAQINLFNAAIMGQGAPACSGLDGLISLAMILGAEEAAASGKTLPLAVEKILDMTP